MRRRIMSKPSETKDLAQRDQKMYPENSPVRRPLAQTGHSAQVRPGPDPLLYFCFRLALAEIRPPGPSKTLGAKMAGNGSRIMSGL